MALDLPFSRRSFFSALGVLPALRLLGAQQGQGAPQQDRTTFSTGVKVVNLFANVRNKSGGIVKDLTKNDFLLGGGWPRTDHHLFLSGKRSAPDARPAGGYQRQPAPAD